MRITRRVWEPLALSALLLGAAALYLWNLGSTGWGNVFYAAAAQAGATDWTSFLYGSSDAGNAITVDKPPASLWLMSLSARLFGISPASVLLPEALIGVATVALTYLIVRRHFSASTALFAGASVAATPAAALIFRYTNPDALLVLLTTLGLYAAVRSLQDTRIRWSLLLGAAFGMAFLTKQLQAFLPLPAIVAVLLFAGRGGLRTRVRGLLVAGAALLVSAGWWVALVMIVPSGARPWIGGTTDDSFFSLTFGYNGLGRILGGSGNGHTFTQTGIDRLLAGSSGMLIGWMLPAAVLLSIVTLIVLGRRPRTDPRRATLLLLGGTMILTVAALSAMSGIYHSYYTVAAAPAIAGCVAVSTSILWARREALVVRVVLAVTLVGTVMWGLWLSSSAPLHGLVPALVVLAALTSAAAIVIRIRVPHTGRVALMAASAAVLVLPLSMSVLVASTGHSGSGASAIQQGSSDGSVSLGVDSAVVQALQADAGTYRWSGATARGSTTAAKYQLASGAAIMPIGGYKHTDPAPTLAQFQTYVAQGAVHWYIGADSGQIGTWVSRTFASRTIGGTVMFDLTAPPAAAASVPWPAPSSGS